MAGGVLECRERILLYRASDACGSATRSATTLGTTLRSCRAANLSKRVPEEVQTFPAKLCRPSRSHKQAVLGQYFRYATVWSNFGEICGSSERPCIVDNHSCKYNIDRNNSLDENAPCLAVSFQHSQFWGLNFHLFQLSSCKWGGLRRNERDLTWP